MDFVVSLCLIHDLISNKMQKLFVPGRLCLFGEHTDWAGHYRTMNADIVPGASIVTGIEQGIYAEVEKSTIFELQSDAPEIAEVWHDFSCRMDESECGQVWFVLLLLRWCSILHVGVVQSWWCPYSYY